MTVRTPDIPDVPPGFIKGFVIKYLTTLTVEVTIGQVKANGKVYTLTGNDIHTMTGLVAGYDIHYIYIDDSVSTAPAATFIDSTTDPVFDSVRDGFYNGDDRCIGVVAGDQSSATVAYFDVAIVNERQIRNFISRFDIPRLANLENPTGNWQVTNERESSTILPINATEIYLEVNGADVLVTAADAAVAGASFEWSQVNTVPFQGAPLLDFSVGNVLKTVWVPLGASRNVRIAGENDDDNVLAAFCDGFGYPR